MQLAPSGSFPFLDPLASVMLTTFGHAAATGVLAQLLFGYTKERERKIDCRVNKKGVLDGVSAEAAQGGGGKD